MTTTAGPSPTTTATSERAAGPALSPTPGRAADLTLLGEVQGSGYQSGAALVRRADGQLVQLGPLLYAVLSAVDGERDLDAIAAAASADLGRRLSPEASARLLEKLAAQGLLAGTESAAPPRRNPLLALRWRVLITNPRITRAIAAPFTFLFRPWLMWPTVAAFAVVCWFVLFRHGLAAAATQAIASPGLLLLVFALTILSAAFHEIGHASACRYSGATPGGMGMGLYLVWPAFYTDVTDAYRLDRRSRLRIDLAGLYFNAAIAVVTTGVWLAMRIDALLLLVALQLLQMLKQLSPLIRADGYHILADATGVPDLYAHMGPTLRRLIPFRRREPSALTGKARALVTIWVLVVVPILISLMVGAVLLLPHLVTNAWDSGRAIAHELARDASVTSVLAGALRMIALALPVVGTVLIAQRLVRTTVRRAKAWSDGHPTRRVIASFAGVAVVAGIAWAWWPSGQYRPVRASDRGTIGSMLGLASRSSSAFRLSPGTYLAVSAVPVGGATANQPALFLLSPRAGAHPVAIVANAPSGGFVTTTDGRTTIASGGTSSGQQAYDATALPFTLPAAPGPHGTQALAVGTANGGVTYDIAYSLVTVTAGAPVDETNSAFAYADCTACTTVAVSFQVVLVVGESNQITPINAAGALNRNCLSCVTTAIADQIVVTITKQPTPDLQRKLEAAISQLGGLPALGANGTPASIAAQVQAVQDQVNQLLQDSGLLVQPLTAPTPDATTAGSPNTSMASAAPTDSASASPTSSSASPAASSSTSTGPSDSAAPSGSDSPSSSTTP